MQPRSQCDDIVSDLEDRFVVTGHEKSDFLKKQGITRMNLVASFLKQGKEFVRHISEAYRTPISHDKIKSTPSFITRFQKFNKEQIKSC